MDRVVFHGLDPERLLLYLAGAAAAVLVLYLIRTTRKRTTVTAGPIWERVIGKRRVSLRELLSYLLQVAVLALMLGTLSDPRDPAGEISRRAVAVVVDASGSMLAREASGRRIDLAKSAARDLVASIAEGDLAMVVRGGEWPSPVTSWTGDRTALVAAIESIEADIRGGDMEGAIRFAADALASVRPGLADRRVLAVVSDRAWAGPAPAGKSFDVHQLVFGSSSENVGLVDFDLRAARGLERGYDVYVKVHNYGRAPARLDLGVHSEEVLFGKVPLTVRPGASEERLYHLDLGGAARSGVRVTAAAVDVRTGPDGTGGDALPLDDRAFGTLPVVRELPVVLVTTGNRFLEEVLRINPEVKLSVKGPGAFDGRVAPGTLVVFDRHTPEPGSLPERSILIEPVEGRAPFKVKKRVPRPKVTDWLGDHPLLKGATVRDLWIEEASLFMVDRADVALVSADGGAIIALREGPGAKRTLVIGFDLMRSDLPLRVAFPVFLRNALRYFGGWAAEVPGGELSVPLVAARPLRVGESAETVALTVTGPTAGADPLRVLAWGGGRFVRPVEAGFHAVTEAGASDPRAVLPVSPGRLPEAEFGPPPLAAPRPDRAGAVYPLASGVSPLAVKALFEATPLPEPRLYWVFLLLLAIAIATTDWILYFLRVLY